MSYELKKSIAFWLIKTFAWAVLGAMFACAYYFAWRGVFFWVETPLYRHLSSFLICAYGSWGLWVNSGDESMEKLFAIVRYRRN